jgi:hypothetical protein
VANTTLLAAQKALGNVVNDAGFREASASAQVVADF